MNLAWKFRFSDSLVMVLDAADGTIVDVNPAFETLTGWRRDDAIGKRPLEVGFWPDSLELRAVVWTRLRCDKRNAGDLVTFRAHDGRVMHGRLYGEMFEHDDGKVYLFNYVQDIGEGAAAPSPPHTSPDAAALESYRALFSAAVEGIYRSLPEGGFIDCNPALARMFGYDTPAQLQNVAPGRMRDMYVDREQARAMLERLNRDGRIDNERLRVYRRDGSVIWVLENARAVRDQAGRVLFYEGTVVDITAQIEAEARLRQSEALYKTLVENCRDGVFLLLHDNVLFANQALADMLGYRLDEILGAPYATFIAPESRDLVEAARVTRTLPEGSVNMLRKDGSRRMMRVTAAPVEFNGEWASTGIVHDVTTETQRRRALEFAERTYRDLFQNAVSGMCRTLPDGRILSANDAFAKLMGYASADELLAEERRIAEFHAEPRYRRFVLAQLLANRDPQIFEFDVRRRDGSVAPVELRAQAVRDSDDKVLFIEGSAQDISARRRAEAALRDSEARYRTLVEHSQVGVYMMREDRYTYVNHAFAAMFGYSEQELLGSDFRMLVPPESREHQEDRYRRRRAGEASGGEYTVSLMRKDGARIEVIVSAGNIVLDGQQYTTGTILDVTEQRRSQRQLEHNATHDLLTGLPNRAEFEHQLALVIADAHERRASDYAVLFLDLDGFKFVNDSLGHASGDVLLVQIADSLRTRLGTQALVARYGGDEFTLLPHGPCSRARAEQLAQRVLALLGGSFDVNGHRVFSSASLGVVLGHADYLSPDQVLRDADTAMYRAKASGKSAYVIFDDAMHAAARERLKLETDLRFALERGEFQIFYQPIVDLNTGAVVASEALLRWQHPERGLLLPDQFVEVAEETGLIMALDWWVLDQTCRNLLRWQRRFPAHARLRANVNMDERQFTDPNLIDTMCSVLRRTGVDPSTLSLEITETIFRGGRTEAEATLRALKDLGVSLVVDDFGTGYSSLDSFATSPFDALKVDRSFVRDMATNFRHRAIVRTITGFAEDLGLRLIAEGVETIEQAELLRGLGCAGAQGFLYAPPLRVEAMERALEIGLATPGDAQAVA